MTLNEVRSQKSEVPHSVPALSHRSSSLRSGAIAQKFLTPFRRYRTEVVFETKDLPLRSKSEVDTEGRLFSFRLIIHRLSQILYVVAH